MCIAIYAPQGKEIPRKHLLNGFNYNWHGAGFCYAKEGKLITQKGFFTFAEFYETFKEINGKYPALVHFRWATHGAHTAENCHPWTIDENHAMIHNGVIKGFGHLDNGRSDTGDFTEFILTPMIKTAPTAWAEPWFVSMMTRALQGNKVLVMDNTGKVAIYGANLGNWRDGIWYSNHDYLPVGANLRL